MKHPLYDPVGLHAKDAMTFRLEKVQPLARGMHVSAVDTGMLWQRVYLVVHIDRHKGTATGLRVPWYFCPRETIGNVWRWIKRNLRGLKA